MRRAAVRSGGILSPVRYAVQNEAAAGCDSAGGALADGGQGKAFAVKRTYFPI